MFKHIVGVVTVAASLIGGGVHYHATHSTLARIPAIHVRSIRTTSIKMPRIKSIKIPKIH